MRNVLAVVLCALLTSQTACTSNPKNIKAEYTSPRLYSAFSCEELFDEQRKIQTQVDDLVGRQKSNRTTDTVMTTVGLVIFWPALLALPFTKDRKSEISRYMGQDEAIKENIAAKRCAYRGNPNGEVTAAMPEGSKPAPTLVMSVGADLPAPSGQSSADADPIAPIQDK